MPPKGALDHVSSRLLADRGFVAALGFWLPAESIPQAPLTCAPRPLRSQDEVSIGSLVKVLPDAEEVLEACEAAGLEAALASTWEACAGQEAVVLAEDLVDSTLECRVPGVGDVWLPVGALTRAAAGSSDRQARILAAAPPPPRPPAPAPAPAPGLPPVAGAGGSEGLAALRAAAPARAPFASAQPLLAAVPVAAPCMLPSSAAADAGAPWPAPWTTLRMPPRACVDGTLLATGSAVAERAVPPVATTCVAAMRSDADTAATVAPAPAMDVLPIAEKEAPEPPFSTTDAGPLAAAPVVPASAETVPAAESRSGDVGPEGLAAKLDGRCWSTAALAAAAAGSSWKAPWYPLLCASPAATAAVAAAAAAAALLAWHPPSGASGPGTLFDFDELGD